MTAQELIECLKEWGPKQQVTLFDKNNVPYKIDRMVIYIPNDGILNHFVIKEEADTEKPPLGVKPYYIQAWQRINELTEAVKRQYMNSNRNAKLVEEWAKEIGWRATIIEALKE